MIFNKNSKAMVQSPDGDTDFFTIVAGVSPGDTLAPMYVKNLARLLCTTNVNRANKRKWFYTKKARSR